MDAVMKDFVPFAFNPKLYPSSVITQSFSSASSIVYDETKYSESKEDKQERWKNIFFYSCDVHLYIGG